MKFYWHMATLSHMVSGCFHLTMAELSSVTATTKTTRNCWPLVWGIPACVSGQFVSTPRVCLKPGSSQPPSGLPLTRLPFGYSLLLNSPELKSFRWSLNSLFFCPQTLCHPDKPNLSFPRPYPCPGPSPGESASTASWSLSQAAILSPSRINSLA